MVLWDLKTVIVCWILSCFNNLKYTQASRNCQRGRWLIIDKNNYSNLDLRNKTCFPCLHSLVKTEANVWGNLRADQWKTCSRILTNFPDVFNRLWSTNNMFYFFYKIIIFIVNKKDDIRSASCKFSQLGDSQTTLFTPFSCFIAL